MVIVKHGLGVVGLKNYKMKVFQKMEFFLKQELDSPGSTDANIFGIRWRTNGKYNCL